MRYRTLGIGLLVAGLNVGPAVGQQCEYKRPSDSVFDIVNDQGSKTGTAVLINREQGLFLTALHLLGSSKLRLKRDGQEFPFSKVLAGSNSASLYEDWAIVTTGKEAGLYEGINLIYDLPSPESWRNAAVYNSAHSVGNVGSVKWNESIEDGKACAGSGVTMMRFNDYDKGDSGSPVFSPDECGIVGLSSRFTLSDNTTDAQEKEVVELFEKLSHHLLAEDRSKIDKETTLEGKTTVVRELLKNEIYVKVVPTKCVVDAVVKESFIKQNEKARKALQASVRNEVKGIFDYLPTVDPDSISSISRFANMVFKQSMRWPEIIELWNRYYEGKINRTLRPGTLSRSLRAAIDDASKDRKFAYLYTTYEREMKLVSSPAPTFDDFGQEGLDFQQFSQRNRDVSTNPAKELDFGSAPTSGKGVERIAQGLEMLNVLKGLNADDRSNDALVSFYQNEASRLLTAGISGTKDGSPISPDTTGRVLIGLAELTEYTPWSMIDDNQLKKLSDLSVALANLGKDKIDPDNTDYISRYEKIITLNPYMPTTYIFEYTKENKRYPDLKLLCPECKAFDPGLLTHQPPPWANPYGGPSLNRSLNPGLYGSGSLRDG